MKRDYTKEQILNILRSAYNDIDNIIMKYIKGCLDKDNKMILEAKDYGFNILTPIQQSLSCVIDFVENN